MEKLGLENDKRGCRFSFCSVSVMKDLFLRRMASTFLAKYLWALHISYWGPCASEHSSNAKPLWNFQLKWALPRCLRHFCSAILLIRGMLQDPKLCKALDVWQRPSRRKGTSGRACGSRESSIALPLGLKCLAPLQLISGKGICPAGLRPLGVLQHLPWLVGDQHRPRIKGTCLLGRAVQSGAIGWVYCSRSGRWKPRGGPWRLDAKGTSSFSHLICFINMILLFPLQDASLLLRRNPDVFRQPHHWPWGCTIGLGRRPWLLRAKSAAVELLAGPGKRTGTKSTESAGAWDAKSGGKIDQHISTYVWSWNRLDWYMLNWS